MTPSRSEAATIRRRQAAHRLLIAIAAIALLVIWVRLCLRPSTDLLNHQEFGRRFVAGTFLYEGGLNYPYLPTWAMAHALLAAVPSAIVSALVFPFGVLALVLLLRILDHGSRAALPLDDHRAFLVAAAAVALTSRFLIRDLVDGGENLLMTALVWGSWYGWRLGRGRLAATLLGAAIALKLTAALFLLTLVARRAYGRALATAVAAAALVALPAVWMGSRSYAAHLRLWVTGVTTGLGWSDASVGILGPEPAGNLGLRPAVGRWMASATPESAGDFSAIVATIAMTAVIGWVMITIARAPSREPLSDLIAWAATGVLALLVSPITWRAHLVAILPACYLLFRRAAVEQRVVASGAVALAAIGVPGLVLARGIAGSRVSQWSDSLSITTIALLLLLAGIAIWLTRR